MKAHWWMWKPAQKWVFRSTPVCPRDHEVLLRHGRGNKRLLCLTKYTSTGNNTNTHTSTSKMLFRTFWGFCYLLSCCYKIDSSKCCQYILPLICCCWGMSRQWRDIFITWESNLFSVIDEKKTTWNLIDWIKMTSWLITPTTHVSVAFCFWVYAMLLWKHEITCKWVSSTTGGAIRPVRKSAVV